MSAASKMTMAHKTDPRSEITEKIGDVSEFKVMFNQLLVAIYLRPDSLDLGGGKKLFLTDQSRNEDRFQGKVGLVLQKGPMAFVDDGSTKFCGQSVEAGDWIVIRPSDGFPTNVKGVLCRMIEDVHVKAVIPRPDYVY